MQRNCRIIKIKRLNIKYYRNKKTRLIRSYELNREKQALHIYGAAGGYKVLTCYGQRKIYQNGVCTTWKCYDFYSKNKTDSVKNKCLLIYSKYPAKFKCLESKIVKIIYKEARVRVNFRHSDVDDIKWAITAQWCNWLISQIQSFRNCYNVISLNETFYMTGFHWSFINAFLVMFY